MTDKPENPPAFPLFCVPGDMRNTSGATLRDYFAAKALQGMCAHHGTYGMTNGPYEIAVRAYEVADAMLKARGQ